MDGTLVLSRLEAEPEALFRRYLRAYCRLAAGETGTEEALDEAREDMEAAVIRAGNAYRAPRGAGG